ERQRAGPCMIADPMPFRARVALIRYSTFLEPQGRRSGLAISVTSPKNLSGHMSDRGHRCGRVPRLAFDTRYRFGRRRDGHHDLLYVLAADGGRSCVVFCPLET